MGKTTKNNKYLISVIMPYYKKKQFINHSINSVLIQTYKNIEIIIICDSVHKDDVQIIKKIKKLDNRIRVFFNSKNIGAGPSRNLAIKYSKGEYIAFLDADDYWLKDKLRIQINYMINNNYNFCHTSYDIVAADNKYISTRIARNFSSFQDLLKSCDIGLSTVMLSKKLLNSKFKFPSLKTKEDFALWLKLSRNKIVLYGLNKSLTRWTITPNSLSSNTLQKITDGFKLYFYYMNFSFLKSIYYLFILSINSLKR